MSEKLTIWQNYDLDPDDECWKEWLDEEYPDANENERWQIICETNWAYLDDERMNLSVALPGRVVMIGSNGLWYGTVHGWSLKKANNLNACLEFMNSCDYAEWYVQGGEFHSRQSHHDGTNHVIYRLLPYSVSDEILERVEYHDCKYEDVMRWTESLAPYVCKVYGWTMEKPAAIPAAV